VYVTTRRIGLFFKKKIFFLFFSFFFRTHLFFGWVGEVSGFSRKQHKKGAKPAKRDRMKVAFTDPITPGCATDASASSHHLQVFLLGFFFHFSLE
jgi:hypothetical protein